MTTLSKDNILNNKKHYTNEIRRGKIFIYPTDTLYGLGVDATNREGVERIFAIKKRDKKPLLIIAPSLQWIEDNCIVMPTHRTLLHEKLPGPYAFIMTLKNKNAIDAMVHMGTNSVGIRIPDCWFMEVMRQAHVPFVTTSVNFSGHSAAHKIADMPQALLDHVDHVIDDDANMRGKASKIIDIRGEERILLRT